MAFPLFSHVLIDRCRRNALQLVLQEPSCCCCGPSRTRQRCVLVMRSRNRKGKYEQDNDIDEYLPASQCSKTLVTICAYRQEGHGEIIKLVASLVCL